jgi:hypothetical protein
VPSSFEKDRQKDMNEKDGQDCLVPDLDRCWPQSGIVEEGVSLELNFDGQVSSHKAVLLFAPALLSWDEATLALHLAARVLLTVSVAKMCIEFDMDLFFSVRTSYARQVALQKIV